MPGSYAQIKDAVLSTLDRNGLRELPINISKWYKNEGWKTLSFSQADQPDVTVDKSKDGETIKVGDRHIVCYSMAAVPDRIRWTLAHEGAHIILGEDSIDAEANYFTEQLLMPIAPIAFLGAETVGDIMRLCRVSREAAFNRMDDLVRHRAYFAKNGYTKRDRQFLRQFGLIK